MSRNMSAVAAVMFVTGFSFLGCRSGSTAPPPVVASPPAIPAAMEAPKPLGPFDWRDAVVYFAIVDRFADGDPSNNEKVDREAKGAFHGGDFKGLTQQLPEIASLGVNALWITPVVKNIPGFVTGAGFPDWGYHGYWADDFGKIDPRFGTEAELAQLVNECHKRGIRVLLDVVYNHAGYNSSYTTDPKFKGWLRTEELGKCGTDDITSCVAGLPDFKTENPEVADFLLKHQIAWAKKLGLDGFRLDTVKHLEHAFWKEHRKRTKEELGKDFFLLGEIYGGAEDWIDPWFEGDEMDAAFDFKFQGSTIGFVQGRGRAAAFDRYLSVREKIRKGYYLSHFLSSHDVDGALFTLEGNKPLFRLAAILQMTTLGIPCIYYGEEVGRLGGKWPENRSDMPWGSRNILPGKGVPRDEDLRAGYVRWIAIRKAHPALSRGVHKGLVTKEKDLYAFLRTDEPTRDAVVVAVNRGAEAQKLSIEIPAEWGDKPVFDRLTDTAVPVKERRVEIQVEPLSARILAPVPQGTKTVPANK